MLSQFLYSAIISIAVIAIIHYLYIFFKDNLTSPKIKDFVNIPTQQYNDIYNTIRQPSAPVEDTSSKKPASEPNNNPYVIKNVSNINDIGNLGDDNSFKSQNLGFIAQYKPEEDMKNELKHFIQTLEQDPTTEPVPHSLM
mgnify:CR=1 FL=1